MKLQLVQHRDANKATVLDVLDYAAFSSQHRNLQGENELRIFEKYHAALSLLSSGLNTFLDPEIRSDNQRLSVNADVAAVDPRTGNVTVVFCQTTTPDDGFWKAIRTIASSDNGRAIIWSPGGIDESTIEQNVPGSLGAKRVSLQSMDWFSGVFEAPMLDALRMLELLVNETRIRMLTPLFQKTTARKKEYRTRINPKLVYSNLDALSEAGLLHEAEEGAYQLSDFGKTMLGEFLTFLEKMRRILDDSNNVKRSKTNGGAD